MSWPIEFHLRVRLIVLATLRLSAVYIAVSTIENVVSSLPAFGREDVAFVVLINTPLRISIAVALWAFSGYITSKVAPLIREVCPTCGQPRLVGLRCPDCGHEFHPEWTDQTARNYEKPGA